MRIIITTIMFSLFICLIAQDVFANDDMKYIENANKFEEKGLYKLSYTKYKDCINDEKSIQCMKESIYFIERLMKKLPEIKKRNITVFEPKKELKTDKIVDYINPFLSNPINLLNTHELSNTIIKQYKSIYEGIISNENNVTEDIEKNDSILRDTDNIKEFLKNLYKVVEIDIQNRNYITDEMADILLNYEQKIEDLKNYRNLYVSYGVVSPYLAATSQLIYIAGLKKVIGYDEQTMRKAMKTMAFGCPRNLVIESSEDVRMQFFDVLSTLKKNMGSREEEELKVLQTLADKLDEQQQLGSKAWWAR